MLSVSNLNSCSCQRMQCLKCFIFRSHSLLQSIQTYTINLYTLYYTILILYLYYKPINLYWSIQTSLFLGSTLSRAALSLNPAPAIPPPSITHWQINEGDLGCVSPSVLWERNKTQNRALLVAVCLTLSGSWRKFVNLTYSTHLGRNNRVSRDYAVARIMILYSAIWGFSAP